MDTMRLAAKLFGGRHLAARLAALDRSQAVIEFDLDGRVLNANDNFLAVTGYSLAEIKGQHHRMFMPSGDAGL